jgi:putrescine aminotransferase
MSMKQLFPFALNKKEPPRYISTFDKFSYTLDGNEIFDAQSGNYSFTLGFNRDDIIDEIAARMKFRPFARFSMTNDAVIELNNLLGEITNDDFDSVFYSLSGSDAVETAVRAAKLYHRKNKKRKYIISYLDSYHGSTHLTSSLTGMDVFSHRLPEYPESFVHHIPQDNDPQTLIDKIEELGPENILAIVKEPVSWQSGLKPTSKYYYNILRDLCTQHDIVFILDEIATGIGKSGEWFAYQRLGIEPDIMCIGKGLTAGYSPLSATLFSRKLHLSVDKTYFVNGWTQSPSMSGVYAAIATINRIRDEGLVHAAYNIEDWQYDVYKKLDVESFRIFGAFGAVDVSNMDQMHDIVARLEKNGVLVTGYRYDPIIRFVFPINIDKSTFNKIMVIVQDVINQ